MHSCYFCSAKPLPVTLAATFHRLLAGERLARSFRMGSQEVGQGRKPWVPYGNQFYLAPHWVTEADSVRSGPWWQWLWATEQISQQAGRTKSQSLACGPVLHSRTAVRE